MAKLHGTWVRQRWPFFPLVLTAACGIVAAHWIPWPPLAWVALGSAGLAGFLSLRNRWGEGGFHLFLFATFALLQTWQSRDSAAARMADWLGDRKPIAEATGVVTREPRVFESGAASFEFQLSALKIGEILLLPKVTVLVSGKGITPRYGDRLELRGVLANLPPPRNPGQFDFAAWSRRQGVYSSLQVSHPNDALLLAPNAGNPLVALALRMRHWMAERLSAGIHDPTVSDLILAMVLGDTSSVDQQIQEDFRGTGTYHLFSVSGLHVGILAVILWYVLKPLRLPRPAVAGLIIPLLFFYALMTGWKPASVRAAMMAAVILAGLMAQRRPILFNNLCAAGFLILLMDTNQLFNPGFQLSFTVVAAILLLGEPLGNGMAKWFAADPFIPRKLLSHPRRMWQTCGQKFATLTSTSMAAWIGSFPLTLGYFHLVSLSSLAANLVAVPVSFGIMGVSTLSLLSSPLSTWTSEIFNQANWLLTRLLLVTIHFFAGLPGSYFYVKAPELRPPLMRVVIFDCGPGGAASLSGEGRHWLIDCGPARMHHTTLVPFLRSQGALTIDGLVMTHGDAQHIGGALELLKSCPPSIVADGPWKDRSSTRTQTHKDLVSLAKPKRLVRAGDRLRISPTATLEILYPETKPGGVADDQALVTRLDIGGTRILFLSDSGYLTEHWLLTHARDDLACDILVRGHHRDGGDLSEDFLDAATPKLVINSATDFPENERLSEEWQQRLEKRGITLFRQDRTGAVSITIDARSWSARTFLDQQTFSHER